MSRREKEPLPQPDRIIGIGDDPDLFLIAHPSIPASHASLITGSDSFLPAVMPDIQSQIGPTTRLLTINAEQVDDFMQGQYGVYQRVQTIVTAVRQQNPQAIILEYRAERHKKKPPLFQETNDTITYVEAHHIRKTNDIFDTSHLKWTNLEYYAHSPDARQALILNAGSASEQEVQTSYAHLMKQQSFHELCKEARVSHEEFLTRFTRLPHQTRELFLHDCLNALATNNTEKGIDALIWLWVRSQQ